MDINRIGVVILSVIVIGVSFAVFPMINSGWTTCPYTGLKPA